MLQWPTLRCSSRALGHSKKVQLVSSRPDLMRQELAEEYCPKKEREVFALRGLQTGVPGVQKRRPLLSPQDFDGRTLMTRMFQSLLAVLAAATERQLARYVQFLAAENRMLRGRLPKRLVVTPQERRRLLNLGQPLGLALREVITIVSYPTFLRWVREAKTRTKDQPKSIGRPKKPLALRELILKIARETGWGYTRVLGEVRKLTSRKVSRQTVRNILRENGLDPGPKRGEKTWDEFIKMHADSLWQCDFFCKRVWTLQGLRDFYVLAFLHVGTRRVWTSTCTAHPDNTWVCQQADAFCEQGRANELPADIVFHDADTKFGKDFDARLKNHGLRPRRLRPVSPNMNAFIERWIQSIQVECLDHFIVRAPSIWTISSLST